LLICVLNLFFQGNLYAQKINLAEWVKHQRDSLINKGIDTIIYFHQYCGECSVIEKKEDKSCEVIDNSWTFIDSYFIYKKAGTTYSLKFNYCNAPIIKKLDSCKSIAYFLSIRNLLQKRDREYSEMRKNAKFFPPIRTDGGYEEAILYCKKLKTKVSISEYQKGDGYKYWKKYFWTDNEIKLTNLILQDLK
jgi:hypothetical protein